MSSEPPRFRSALNTYLNDHLAGAVAGLQLVDHLIGSAGAPSDAAFFRELREEIAEDRATLETLLERVGGRESGVRQLGGWIAEKVGRLKLVMDDPTRGTLERLEALEILVLGIHGKQLMWRALGAVTIPGLEGTDFQHLERRAVDQRDKVEARRLEVARQLSSASD